MNTSVIRPNPITPYPLKMIAVNFAANLWANKWYLLRDLYLTPADCITIRNAGDMGNGSLQSYVCTPLISMSEYMSGVWKSIEWVKAPQEWNSWASTLLKDAGDKVSEKIYGIADVVEEQIGEGAVTQLLTDIAYKTRYNTDYVIYKDQLNHPDLLSLQNLMNMVSNPDVIRLYSIYDTWTASPDLFYFNLQTNLMAKLNELRVEVAALENAQFLNDCRNQGSNCLEVVVSDLTATKLFDAYFPDTVAINYAFVLSKIATNLPNLGDLAGHSAAIAFDTGRAAFKYQYNENINSRRLENLKKFEHEALVGFVLQYKAFGYESVCENDKHCNEKLQILVNKIDEFDELDGIDLADFADLVTADIALHNTGQVYDNGGDL